MIRTEWRRRTKRSLTSVSKLEQIERLLGNGQPFFLPKGFYLIEGINGLFVKFSKI
ncbi:MAG: hypothetical protein RIS68_1375 [Bacteroidota bacterium]